MPFLRQDTVLLALHLRRKRQNYVAYCTANKESCNQHSQRNQNFEKNVFDAFDYYYIAKTEQSA